MMPKPIKIPEVIWALGDKEPIIVSAVYRPIYYKGIKVGWINPEYSEQLMKILLKDK